MNGEVKKEKFRALSIAALVTGVLFFVCLGVYFIIPFDFYDVEAIPSVYDSMLWLIISPLLIGLPITAIICGAIDLRRIRAGLYGNKGIGMDITGIALGGIAIFFTIAFVILAILWVLAWTVGH